jgi:hypothetical protein
MLILAEPDEKQRKTRLLAPDADGVFVIFDITLHLEIEFAVS